MATTNELVTAFYGADPLAGEDASIALREQLGAQAIEAVLPLTGLPHRSSHQIEVRLAQLGAALGPSIVPHLASAIARGTWTAKLCAAPCFLGLPSTEETTDPLIDILKHSSDIDAQRLAIEALGALGAAGWAEGLEDFAKNGEWGRDQTKRVSTYDFDKFSSYVVEALARFAAKPANSTEARYRVRSLTSFMKLCDVELGTSRAPSTYNLVERHAHEFSELSVDPIIDNWASDPAEAFQRLACHVVGQIAPTRAAKFLLDMATAPAKTAAVRTSASIALGEIRHTVVAERVADRLKASPEDGAHLNWAFSTLYAVPIAWPPMGDYVELVLRGRDEPAAQLRYSLALKGDDRCRKEMIDLLDHGQPFERWTAALALARLLGSKSLPYLEHRAEDAGDEIERCAMYAAEIRGGADKSMQLHEALQMAPALPLLRSVWRLEILDAFRTAGGFDPRAVDLWRSAARVHPRIASYFDTLHARGEPDAEPGAEQQPATPSTGTERTKVFVSYSRRDGQWLKRFQSMLSPLIDSERVDLWDDTKMQPGKWQSQIESAMSVCHVALFLVSEHFFASKFIKRHELPALLGYAEKRNVTVLWVLLSDAVWEESPLSEYQGENPDRPLSRLPSGERTLVIKKTCMKIRELLRR